MPNPIRYTFCLVFGLLFALSAVVTSGCALLNISDGRLFWNTQKQDEGKNLLPSIQTATGAMKIEIVFLERPVGDRLLGPALWNEIAEVGTVAPEERKLIRETGLRVGNAGSSWPRSLQRLIELNLETDEVTRDEQSKQIPVRRITLRSGGEALIHGIHHEKCSIEIPDGESLVQKEYEDATGVFRMSAHRVQDGWARLEFQPEIHSGPSTMRAVPAKGTWTSTFQQEIDPFLKRKFSVDLHIGEWVVITADGDNPHSVGHCCFVKGMDNQAKQRVLLVRVMNMGNLDAVYAN